MSDCPFESDVLDALASRRWPAKADDNLRAHVPSCESCHTLAITAQALMAEHDAAYAEARVPSSAAVWHRAQLRAREDAVRTATRPIGFVQGVAFAFGVAVAIGVAVWSLPLLSNMEALVPDISPLLAWFRAPALETPWVDSSLLSNSIVQVAIAGWLFLAPAALYFALSRE